MQFPYQLAHKVTRHQASSIIIIAIKPEGMPLFEPKTWYIYLCMCYCTFTDGNGQAKDKVLHTLYPFTNGNMLEIAGISIVFGCSLDES
jgi:hypothetical protein